MAKQEESPMEDQQHNVKLENEQPPSMAESIHQQILLQQQQQQSAPSTSTSGDKAVPRKRYFSKELRCMMYGFGDDQNPYTETVDMLEDLVIHFIGDTALRALEVGRSGKVTVEDVMYLVRRDPRKYSRIRDLLSMNEELKKARKAFDEVKYVQSV